MILCSGTKWLVVANARFLFIKQYHTKMTQQSPQDADKNNVEDFLCDFSKNIQIFCNSGDVEKAHNLLKSIMEHKNNNTHRCLKPHYFNCVSVAYAKDRKCIEATEICNHMRKYGFRPHQTTYHSIMSAFLKQGKVLEALDMFDAMRRDGWHPNEVTRSIIAYGLCRKGYTDQISALFRERIEKSGVVSTSIFNALLESLFRSGDDEGVDALEKRILSGSLCLVNVYTYATMIRGRCVQGKVDEARNLFSDMEKKGFQPILGCYGSIISTLCKRGEYRDAHNMFEGMLQKGIKAKGEFCLVLLKGLCIKGMAYEALRVCETVTWRCVSIGDEMFFSLLEALSKGDKLGEAKPLLESLMQKGFISNVRCFRQAMHTLKRREILFHDR